MGGKHIRFQKNPKFVHKRSEGLTCRGQKRIQILLRARNPVAAIPVSDTSRSSVKGDVSQKANTEDE